MIEKSIPFLRLRAIHHHSGPGFCIRVFLTLACVAWSATALRATVYGLGATTLLIGPAAGNGSVALAVAPARAAWTATANATWLHLNAGNRSGTGSTNVVFRYDANTGTTRSGTLTIAGLMLTVGQAGSTYVPAQPLTTLVNSGLSFPSDVAVDGVGNVYIADSGNHAIKKWIATDTSVVTLVSSGMNGPSGVAVDGVGNIYIADT